MRCEGARDGRAAIDEEKGRSWRRVEGQPEAASFEAPLVESCSCTSSGLSSTWSLQMYITCTLQHRAAYTASLSPSFFPRANILVTSPVSVLAL